MATPPTMSSVQGIDFTLPQSPPIVLPPLSLLDLSVPLIDDENTTAQQRDAVEKVASAQADVSAAADRLASASHEERMAAERDVEDARDRLTEAEALAGDLSKRLADSERWLHGFQYLPELSLTLGVEVVAPDAAGYNTPPAPAATKPTGTNQSPFLWYDPFTVVARDERSLFGFPLTDYDSRARRALRALRGYESTEVEEEFWNGLAIPTNFHLSASPSTPTSSPHRTTSTWPNPDAAPGTVLGTAVGLGQALAALDQAIADNGGGTGMVHATPYLVQRFMSIYPYIRDSDGKVYTVNHNLLVPGYGYPGTGPDVASRQVTDGVLAMNTTLTSATAAFTTLDIGSTVTDDDGEIPAGTYIIAVASPTSVTLSQPTTASESGATITIGASQARIDGNRYQWAYATEMVYKCRGDYRTIPWDLRQMSPQVNVDNNAPVRVEREWAPITNQFVRSAVLVDTTLA
jgi:hypothetical protein